MTKNNTEISKEDLLKAYMLVVNAPMLSKEDKVRANQVLDMKGKIRDVIQLLDIPLKSLQTNYSLVAKEVDVTQYVMSHQLGIKEADWDKAEKEVDKINKEQREKLAKEYVDKLKSVVKGDEPAVDPDGNKKVIPFPGVKSKGANK